MTLEEFMNWAYEYLVNSADMLHEFHDWEPDGEITPEIVDYVVAMTTIDTKCTTMVSVITWFSEWQGTDTSWLEDAKLKIIAIIENLKATRPDDNDGDGASIIHDIETVAWEEMQSQLDEITI